MSLADQSQQWFPTSVQVTVHQARNLRAKGKNGTNDSYAIIQVAKDKFSTSVSEKSVDPVWKEEASFDLPLFHPSNSDRCTLFIIVMHRAQVGLDKFLGQAVVKLLDLHDNKTSKKTDWFKLVDKSGKEDKARGEVLLDIQFMRNNMSASMIDLSMQDKPRSRMSKFKDKVRGKKKDSFSDSSSAVVSSVGTVLTDSEGDADAQSLSQADGVKKKSKLKTLFAPKSNLQRNVSQSMSTLGTLPARNSSISSSRSSGLNVDSTEVKKKFKFRGHKRTESSDSKVSLGPLSLLGRSKQSSSDLNNTCVNGSHVYAEETDPTSGSTVSLNSSGQGSVEEVHKFREVCVDSFVSVPVPSLKLDSADGAILEQQRHQEEEERRRQTEEKRLAEAKRLEEEEKHRLEARRLQEEEEQRRQEEQERKRRFLEEEARREEERKKQEEAAESQRLEEQRRQEEASMSDRLTSLFGILRKKEEKKEELPSGEDPVQTTSHSSPSPFEDIPLGSDPPPGSNESPADHQTSISNPQTPTSMVFLNRNAKVSAVKPRLTQSLESEPADCQTPSHSESTLSSVPSESPDTFSTLHSLLDPRQSHSPSGSPSGSTEDLTSAGSSPTMADKRRRAPTPPSYTTPGGNAARESRNHAGTDGPQPGRKMSLPLPDYDTLYPQKRHGVQGETRWDHIIAEVNQKHRDYAEMSVDGPEEHKPSFRSSLPQESPAANYYNRQPQESKPVSSKKVAAPAPPKSAPTHLRSESSQSQSAAHHHEDTTRGSPSVTSREVLHPSPAGTHAPRPASQVDQVGTAERGTSNKYAPTAKPRLRTSGAEPVEQEDAAVTSDTCMTSHIQTYRPHMISTDTNSQQAKENFNFDPFPSNDLLSKDPWEADDFITSSVQKEQKVEDRGMTPDDLDQIFAQEKQTDPFADFNGRDSSDSSPVSQRRNSQRRKQVPASTDATTSRPRQEYKEETSSTSADQVPARSVSNESTTPKLPANAKTQSQYYGGEDQFTAQPFISTLNLSERLEVVIEEVEPASQPGGLSGGKAPLRAWVSPSDVQRVSAQSSNGDGLAFTPRRPHPVKPMNSDSQYPISSPAVKDMKVRDSSAGKLQAADPVGSGPFTQLTQEELITLVVRQQADLSKKDNKITELEEYIDNLLVRVIDEQPNILQALNFTKPV